MTSLRHHTAVFNLSVTYNVLVEIADTWFIVNI